MMRRNYDFLYDIGNKLNSSFSSAISGWKERELELSSSYQKKNFSPSCFHLAQLGCEHIRQPPLFIHHHSLASSASSFMMFVIYVCACVRASLNARTSSIPCGMEWSLRWCACNNLCVCFLLSNGNKARKGKKEEK